ncbi:MAG TPA: LLM class flavin-dependent oxidoreductase [Thermoleophilaceae bacterium]|nr:LLM class flavin-dependent oxidoreductase [Thermoleophilaceae bacterium]
MRVCLMIEGQEDVTWEDWVALARACEEHGVESLFRSDHYLSVEGRGRRASLDAWATLAALAGFPFPPLGERMGMLDEQLQVVTGQWADGPFSFEGRHYEIKDLDAHPKPVQRPRPPLIMGGSGGPRSLRLAARWCDAYNTVYKTPRSAPRCGATSTRPAAARDAPRSRCRS